MEWYERRPAEYRNDTWHLSLAEHGAYNLLLDHYYSNESPLPDNDRALASICGCTIDEWLSVSNALRQFFTAKRGKLLHKKCDEIIEKSFTKRNDGAKRVAKYRKNKGSVTRTSRVSNAPTGQDRTGQDKEKENIKRKTLIDENFRPNERAYDVGRKQRFTSNEVDRLCEQFVDWAIEGGKKTIDWNRKFYNWIRSDLAQRSVSGWRTGGNANGKNAGRDTGLEAIRNVFGDSRVEPEADAGTVIDMAGNVVGNDG